MSALSRSFRRAYIVLILMLLAFNVEYSIAVQIMDVYIIAGQSNAAGAAYASTLSHNIDTLGISYDSYAANDTSIFYSHRAMRHSLDSNPGEIMYDQPLGQLRIKPDGKMGPEMSVARDLAQDSNYSVALIKFVTSGGPIAQWLPNTDDLYYPFVEYLVEQSDTLEAEGYIVRWKGMFWIQGESDSTASCSPSYVSKFTTFSDQLRNDLLCFNMPVVMSQIKSNLVDQPWYEYSRNNPYAAVINDDMALLALDNPLLELTCSNNDLDVFDGIHYTADNYVELGHRLSDTYLLHFGTDYLSSDFNEDGTVDSEDIGVWKYYYGITNNATHRIGDADDDGDVDGIDFIIWQQEYGSSSFSLASIPEPSTFILCSLITPLHIIALALVRCLLPGDHTPARPELVREQDELYKT